MPVCARMEEKALEKKTTGYPCRRIIRAMVNESGMSASEISRAMGRSSGYVNTLLSSGAIPGADTFAEIANACGYRVVIESPYHTERYRLLDQNETKAWLNAAISNMDSTATDAERSSEAFKRTRAAFYRDAGEKSHAGEQAGRGGGGNGPSDEIARALKSELDKADIKSAGDYLARRRAENQDNSTDSKPL